METLKTMFDHRSIRKYKSTPVSEPVLQNILKAATRASTTGNMQIYSIVVTKDEEKRKAMHTIHFGQDMVLQAPVLLTFCADINRFNKWCKLRDAQPGYDNFLWFLNAAIDAMLAAQNAAIAAEEHELGICYLGTTTYQADKIIDLLNLPYGVVPVTTLVVGYPDEQPPLTDRLPLEAVVHYESYADYNEQIINDLYLEKENLQLTKELLEENNLENLAKIFTERRYKKDDNLHFSKAFLNTLHKQGFMNHDE